MSDQKLRLGVMTYLYEGADESLRRVADLGLECCQVGWMPFSPLEQAQELRAAADRHGVFISTLWAVLPGVQEWSVVEGPRTIGLVPPETRAERVRALQAAAEIAGQIGVQSITTHCGFIPPDPYAADYLGTVSALQGVTAACADHGVEFWYETGQETPVVLLRTIEDVGYDKQGINLDPANLLIYGNANPVDALDVFGQWVRGTHCKDAEYPTGGRVPGEERPLGEGRVNFPVLISKLKTLGFRGDLVIEREITGPQQIEDIKRAMALLEPLR